MKLKKKIGIRGPTANIHIVYNSIRSLSLSLYPSLPLSPLHKEFDSLYFRIS